MGVRDDVSNSPLLDGPDTDSRPANAEPRDDHVSLLGLQHTYRTPDGSSIEAISWADITVRSGEFLGIIGPSGCGKSTLLKITAGLVRPTGGEVRVAGLSIREQTPSYGMVFQSPVLLPWRTVAENVALPLEVRKTPKAARMEKVEHLLDLVDLNGFENNSPRELSGGMQQRVALARALTTDPPMLLLDEPFGALDALTREQLNLELLQICGRTGTTALLVTHSIPEAVFLSDRVVVMGPRPSTIRGELEVPLPRPRELKLMGSEEFGRLTNRVRDLLSGHGAV